MTPGNWPSGGVIEREKLLRAEVQLAESRRLQDALKRAWP